MLYSTWSNVPPVPRCTCAFQCLPILCFCVWSVSTSIICLCVIHFTESSSGKSAAVSSVSCDLCCNTRLSNAHHNCQLTGAGGAGHSLRSKLAPSGATVTQADGRGRCLSSSQLSARGQRMAAAGEVAKPQQEPVGVGQGQRSSNRDGPSSTQQLQSLQCTWEYSLLLPATPCQIRDEVEVILSDLIVRLKQLLFNSLLCAYYVGFIPMQFADVSLCPGWTGLNVGLSLQSPHQTHCNRKHSRN